MWYSNNLMILMQRNRTVNEHAEIAAFRTRTRAHTDAVAAAAGRRTGRPPPTLALHTPASCGKVAPSKPHARARSK